MNANSSSSESPLQRGQFLTNVIVVRQFAV